MNPFVQDLNFSSKKDTLNPSQQRSSVQKLQRQETLIFKEKHVNDKFKLNMLGENNQYQYIGSSCGWVMTILCALILILYFVECYSDMINLRNDMIRSTNMNNDLKLYNNLSMQNFNWMTYFDLQALSEISQVDYDIYTESYIQNPVQQQELAIDLTKLEKYFQIRTVVRHIIDGQDKFYYQKFKMCSQNDFDKIQYNKPVVNVGSFICQNTDQLKDVYQLQNLYTNKQNRMSFSIEIHLCNSDNYSGQCADPNKTKILLNKLQFTQYYVDEVADLLINYGSRPINQNLRYLQQFSLNYESYRDNNNFFTHSLVETSDQRYNKFFLKNRLFGKQSFKECKQKLFYINQRIRMNNLGQTECVVNFLYFLYIQLFNFIIMMQIFF